MTSAEELASYLGAPIAEVDGTRLVPMLCEREGERALDRSGWLFELKLDGVRIIADKRGDRVALTYRKLRDATASYAEIADAIGKLAESRIVLDGEIVAFGEDGKPDFQKLGHRIQVGTANRAAMTVPVVYVVFDVLAVGKYDLRGFPLEARKEILGRVLGGAGGMLRPHPTFTSGVDLFRLCREKGLEGVVAKKLGSTYQTGERTLDWLKIKAEHDAEFVVIGWTEGESDRAKLGALDLGAYEGDRLVFRGRVGSGLDLAMIDRLLERLEPIEVSHPVAQGKYSPKPRRHHCLPQLVVSVRYQGFSLDPSGARFLRFPVFRGLREDVDPKDCTAAPDEIPRPAKTRKAPVAGGKEVLGKYFETVAPVLLRHARGRVCSLLRPDGTVLWPPPKRAPKFARTAVVRAAGKEFRGFVVDSIEMLLFAVESGSPMIQHGPFLEDRHDVADFVPIRVTAVTRADLARAAHAVRDLAREVGLPAKAISVGPRAVDVVVALGAAPAAAATLLGTLLGRLAGDAAPTGVTIAAGTATPTAFAPCAMAGNAEIMSVPLAWDEIERLDLGTVGFASAAERAARGDGIAFEEAVDFAAATRAIERIVARR